MLEERMLALVTKLVVVFLAFGVIAFVDNKGNNTKGKKSDTSESERPWRDLLITYVHDVLSSNSIHL